MFEKRAFQRSWLRHFPTFLVLIAGMTLSAAPPAWWTQPDSTGHSVIDSAVTDSNPQGPANIGQAKFMAKRALDAVNTLDPSLATQIREKLVYPQPSPSAPDTTLPAILDLEVPGEPLPADWRDRQHAPLLIGQLKAIAAPFYDVLHVTFPTWLDNESSAPTTQGQLQRNGTKDRSNPSNYYPWSANPGDDKNQSPATIGQLKAVFSLRLEALGAILDSDHDGLTYDQEVANHTDPHNPDSDGDGMNDAWEVQWGLDPLNPADAAGDPDGDNLSNLMESQSDTPPTGSYRIEVLPTGTTPYFHSAADDGSVVVQASPIWDGHSALELITAPDTAGNRTRVPLPPDDWWPLDTTLANLIADGTLNEGDALNPIPLGSSTGSHRVFQTHANLLILRVPGFRVGILAPNVPWQAINNNGQAVAITERVVPTTDGIPEHLEADLLISYGYYTDTIPLPAVWFPTLTTPSIQAFSDNGDVLVLRQVTEPDGRTLDETYLLKAYQDDFVLVRQPAFGGECIIALSSANGRMLGIGTKPFQITPDGTPLLLEALQILTSASAPAVPLATLYPAPLIPHHITSDGRITLSTTDADNQPILLQIVPTNDSDADSMMDDWEKWFAKMLLDTDKPLEEWGALAVDLLGGNLNPAIDYTGDGITAGEIGSLFNRPVSQQSTDGIELDFQGRRNILAWGLHVPATQNTKERNEGLYYYENEGYYGAAMDIDGFSQLQPYFMHAMILTNSWSRSTFGSGLSRFLIQDSAGGLIPIESSGQPILSASSGQPIHTEYSGQTIHSRIRLVATTPTRFDRTRSYVKVTRRSPYPTNYVSLPEVMDIEAQEPTIPAGNITSDWIELIPPVVAGYEYTVTLEPVSIAVDANRDGLVTFDGKDGTTAAKPFVFWVNDDHDVKHPVDLVGVPFPATLGQEDVFDGVKDCSDGVITCVRDLEDFTRLHFSVGCIADELKNGSLSVGLEFTDATGAPSIKVYLAKEEDGGIMYLLKNTAGEAQLADTKNNTTLGTVGESLEFKFPIHAWDTLSPANPNTHLIFEGVNEGKGRLQLTLYKNAQRLCSFGSVWIDLKNIRQMYQRWNANEVEKGGVQSDIWPSKSATQDYDSTDPPAPETDGEKDFILFVHGWNMTIPEKRAFAETAYKRLWQIGYKGRFGAFFWPTFFEGGSDPRNFNGSEHRAWESSNSLLDLLTQLNRKYPGRLNVLAHSMGNVVASEALHKASSIVVKNYIASQAALPADVFKLNPDISKQWDEILATAFTGYNIKLPLAKEVKTPNVYAYYFSDTREFRYCTKQYPEMGKPYMAGISGASKWHNYLNPNDWALGLWIHNQAQKPTSKVFTYSPNTSRDYLYTYFSGLSTWGFWADESGSSNDHGLYFGERDKSPDSTYEIFSYCAQARCRPTGRQSNVGGPFKKQQNFSDYGDKHQGHSAQFLEAICNRWTYWYDVTSDCQISHINNLGGQYSYAH